MTRLALALLLVAHPGPRPLASFKELVAAHTGEQVRLQVAPVGVAYLGPKKQGLLYPEPCAPADPAVGPDGRSAVVLNVGGLPPRLADRLNRESTAETARGQSWTCYELVVRITAIDKRGEAGGVVDAVFVSATASGQRPVDKRLLGGD